MGCFLACFGFSKKRRRRKPANRAPSGDHSHGSYRPLDSDVNIIPENPNCSESEQSGKERSSLKIKKKVSFNLNVKAYEPLPSYDFSGCLSESEEERCEESENAANSRDPSESKTTYPSGHRYQNCRDSYDEEDDIKLEDSDLDGEEECNDDEEQEEIGEDENWAAHDHSQIAEEKTSNDLPVADSLDQELKKLGLGNSRATRDRSQYVFSVLNPVENLSQWKAVKAKPPLKQQRKENINPFSNQSGPVLQEIAVDASLSNWLVSSKTGDIASILQRR